MNSIDDDRRIDMGKHKFFAWATVFCFMMTMITGYTKGKPILKSDKED